MDLNDNLAGTETNPTDGATETAAQEPISVVEAPVTEAPASTVNEVVNADELTSLTPEGEESTSPSIATNATETGISEVESAASELAALSNESPAETAEEPTTPSEDPATDSVTESFVTPPANAENAVMTDLNAYENSAEVQPKIESPMQDAMNPSANMAGADASAINTPNEPIKKKGFISRLFGK
ncbi:TPA: hypothetical protein DDW69_01565 [candidate division CPR2 bacterium]|uniref:Uncharacterized protein n=1 Tax=candidate division CPR2 bacterium GW2011_GWC1_41_48 TaxID=1618344 RepID=A0A0G0YJL0_UNCC2|nr:MAG: hypothetical protein UT47_C0001G0116 [candidate division CPR2 bacterium GW2011_GWC2_39_35]KKS09711.1 MAG: hypothetical protein UU65_C0001G0116 [candidate division CPR2 bacterium GW2011_GWC1_41_48]HBG81508.1 hypothetical protein [candidate division CPR2 bacterium]HCL99527.1 hypothetical protein [candidate division CPR2 bacterium]